MRNLVVTILGLCSTKTAVAAEWTSATAAGLYRDQMIASEIYSQQITASRAGDQGMSSRIGLDVTQTKLHLEPSADTQEVDLGSSGEKNILTTSVSIGQTLAYFHSLQLFYDQSKGDSTSAHALGGGYEAWILKDRLRLGLFYQRNNMTQQSKDFTDIDGKRVITPERTNGKNYRLETMTYLQPTTIMRANYSRTRSDDRPDASSVAVQIRQYVDEANAAAHMSYQHYENLGTIEANTTTGEIVSDRYAIEWHQKMGQQYIGLLGYRLAKEVEKPRAFDNGYKQYGSDYAYTSLRYRTAKSWTFRSNELSAMYGKYLRNDGLSGYLVGIGLDLIF